MTLTPVTNGGWYEHTDGTVGRYSWQAGQVVLQQTVASWDAVETTAERLEREAKEQGL